MIIIEIYGLRLNVIICWLFVYFESNFFFCYVNKLWDNMSIDEI